MSNKVHLKFEIYPGVALQGDLEDIRIWCKSNGVVFSSLFRGKIKKLIKEFKDNPENLKNT